MKRPLFREVDLGGGPMRALDLDHPWVVERVREDMAEGIAVYYDRRWGLTRRFCRFLLQNPRIVEGRRVFAAGVGAGLEAVALGRLAEAVVVNDLAPASLRLAARQLEENDVTDYVVAEGRFEEANLSAVDLVVGCFVVYDASTRDAMMRLLERTDEARIPVLLANEEVGPYFAEVLDTVRGRVESLLEVDRSRIVRITPAPPRSVQASGI